jgi:hypothetical protein
MGKLNKSGDATKSMAPDADQITFIDFEKDQTCAKNALNHITDVPELFHSGFMVKVHGLSHKRETAVGARRGFQARD